MTQTGLPTPVALSNAGPQALAPGAAANAAQPELEGQASEDFYRALFDSLDDGFCVIEKVSDTLAGVLDFVYIEANPAFALQSGVQSAAGVVGNTIRQLFPGISDDWFRTYDAVLKTGVPTRFERELAPYHRWLELYVFPVALHKNRLGIIFKDITQRVLAQKTLREAEAFNRSILSSSSDCIKILSREGHLLAILSGQHLLDISDVQPLLNKSWLYFWAGPQEVNAQAAINSAVAGGKGNFVGFFVTPTGRATWWDVAISPILDANGKLVRLLAVSREVTQRKQTELALEFLASISQRLMGSNHVDDMMLDIGASVGAYLKLSDCAFAEIDKGSRHAVIKHHWRRHDAQGLAGDFSLADFEGDTFIQAALAAKAIVVNDAANTPYTVPHPFAERNVASFLCLPLIREGQGCFALCLCKSERYEWREDEIALARELTARIGSRMERLRADGALQKSEARFRALFDWGPIAMYSCDSAGVIQDYNRGAVKIWQTSPKPGDTDEQFRGSFKTHLPDGTFIPYAKTAMTQVLRHGAPAINDLEVVLERPNGSRITLVVNVVPLKNDAGQVTGAITCFYDITERSLLERKTLEQADALADRDRRKDEFLAMLSHELRNPLAPISNAVRLLRLQKNEDPVQLQARNIIERQVGQLNRLVDDLLEISRITTGRVQLRPEHITISGIVERAVETTQPLITQRHHTLTVSMPTAPLWVHADAARLEQVVVNLLTNAAKYTDEGGSIALGVQHEGDYAVLRVTDNGIGIAPELLPHIFELFTQAERSLDRSQGGLGIGLCLVQRLVTLHGGSVDVQSVLGAGSEFVVRLPMIAAPHTLPPSPLVEIARSSDRPSPVRVLVVDDNVDAAQSLADLLNLSGHEVRLAYDGLSAVEVALAWCPDVVLLDIGLPDLNGFEVAKRIRSEARNATQNASPKAAMVLVALTGYGQVTDRQRALDAGFDHHLVKPADFDEVENILRCVAPACA